MNQYGTNLSRKKLLQVVIETTGCDIDNDDNCKIETKQAQPVTVLQSLGGDLRNGRKGDIVVAVNGENPIGDGIKNFFVLSVL